MAVFRALHVLAVGLIFSANPVLAHHGDAGRFDENPVTLLGTVVSLQLMNPHSIIVLDVEDKQGEVVRWQAEFGSPWRMVGSFGWTKDTLQPGDKITITGRRAKSGAPLFNITEQARIVRTDSGEELFDSEPWDNGVDND